MAIAAGWRGQGLESHVSRDGGVEWRERRGGCVEEGEIMAEGAVRGSGIVAELGVYLGDLEMGRRRDWRRRRRHDGQDHIAVWSPRVPAPRPPPTYHPSGEQFIIPRDTRQIASPPRRLLRDHHSVNSLIFRI